MQQNVRWRSRWRCLLRLLGPRAYFVTECRLDGRPGELCKTDDDKREATRWGYCRLLHLVHVAGLSWVNLQHAPEFGWQAWKRWAKAPRLPYSCPPPVNRRRLCKTRRMRRHKSHIQNRSNSSRLAWFLREALQGDASLTRHPWTALQRHQ